MGLLLVQHGDGDGGGAGGQTNWSSIIGIVTAITGNALIALALNVQRYAHIRVHKKRAEIGAHARQARKKSTQNRAAQQDSSSAPLANATTSRGRDPRSGGGPYGAVGATQNRSRGNVSRDKSSVDAALAETQPLAPNSDTDPSDYSSDEDTEPEATVTYLKDAYWWLGQILISVGEMGNFLAYGFAPASIVSPLGVVALISNCIIAPLFFREAFRPRDFWGVTVAIGGAVTVVLSAKQEETKLGPHDVWDAITTMEFEAYMGVSCALILLLMWLSPRHGHRTILIDLGLVGLFGGYTALSTKGVSSMLSSTLFGAFTTPVTYILCAVLLITGVLQVRYLNKALQRFDSTQVIPTQFVLFTLSVIIGSAVLYRDFERTTAEQAAKFVGGCLLTFFGVFLITSGRPRADHDGDALSDDEHMDETIRLAEQEPPSEPQAANSTPPWREGLSHAGRRQDANGEHAMQTGDSAPSTVLSMSASGMPCLPPNPQTHPLHIMTQDLAHPHNPGSQLMATERPVTPRASAPGAGGGSWPNTHHYGASLISPSPFSSTVSAVVADKLLAHMDAPMLRKVVLRRSRRNLRSSLFVPVDELHRELEYSDMENQVESATASDDRRDSGYAEADQLLAPCQTSVRGRARSLSRALGDLIGSIKRRRISVDAED